jgi:iron(III) transport system substrate-binding protein
MRSFKKPLMGLAVLFTSVSLMTGCGGGNLSETEKIVREASKMSYEELVAKAKEEVGDNTVLTFGNSSQFGKALAKFTEETGIKVENSKKGDAETYQELGEAFAADRYIADMVLLQDGNKLQTEMLANDYLVNFVPKDVKSQIAEDDQEPLAAVYLNKVFMYNNTNYDGTNADTASAKVLTNYLTNVWQLAGTTADAGHIHNTSFKTPSSENVNMNFLVMLTSPEWCKKLETAYKAYYGKDYVKEDKYENIGYKWIAEFLTNGQAHSSDGTACKDTASGKGGSMALVNLNKNKDCKDTGIGKQDKNNLSYPAMEVGDNLQGFGGFCYKMYALVADNAKYPYAACAIVNYVVSKAGFEAAWGAKDGYYSSNTTAAVASSDKEISWWKQRLVIEDPEYVAANYRDVFQFVQQYEGK